MHYWRRCEGRQEAPRTGGVVWPQRWWWGGAEVVGEVTVALDTMEVVVEDVEVLAVVLGGWQAGMALPVTSKTS